MLLYYYLDYFRYHYLATATGTAEAGAYPGVLGADAGEQTAGRLMSRCL